MDRSGHDDTIEHLEADAVCERCSTVNPQGTLLCKMCGNNLRDQRNRRMSGEGAAEVAVPATGRSRQIITGVLGVFVLLVILWVAFNVDTIASAMIQGIDNSTHGAAAEDYWTGPDHEKFDGMLQTLQTKPVSEAEITLATTQPPISSGYDGRYVIKRNADVASAVIGQGIAETRGDTVYFLATLSGGIEIRGIAQITSETKVVAEHAGFLQSEAYAGCYGIGNSTDTGRIECAGYPEDSQTAYSAIAFRIPEVPGGGPLITEPAN